MTLSDRQLLDTLTWLPFIDTALVADILSGVPATTHRRLMTTGCRGHQAQITYSCACLTNLPVCTKTWGLQCPPDWIRTGKGPSLLLRTQPRLTLPTEKFAIRYALAHHRG